MQREVEMFAAVIRDFVRLRAALTMNPARVPRLPEDLAAAKKRLDQLHARTKDHSRRLADYNLFYRIGVELSLRREPISMGELSRALAVPVSTATRMVDWQVANGYVERLSDPNDRRVVRLALTQAGRDLYHSIERFLRGRIERVLRKFAPDDRKNLVRLMQQLVEVLMEVEG